jgi:hypothetical protein
MLWLASAAAVQPAQAVEYGLSEYVLGLAIPMSGYTPPPGVYFSDVFYIYSGVWYKDATKANYNFVASGAIVNWVTDLDVLGGSLGFGVNVPFGGVRNSALVPTVGPSGFRQQALADSVNAIGNVEVAAFIGWQEREHHWNAVLIGFIPSGAYDPNRIAFTSLNRPAIDIKGAYTFLSLQTGFEASAALGLTINAVNAATNYQSGAELHFEWALNQHFPFGLAAGVGGYFYQQVTDDGGPTATLGPYKGRVAAIGPLLSYTFKADAQELTLSGRWFHEFAAEKRVQGDAIFASLSFRL